MTKSIREVACAFSELNLMKWVKSLWLIITKESLKSMVRSFMPIIRGINTMRDGQGLSMSELSVDNAIGSQLASFNGI